MIINTLIEVLHALLNWCNVVALRLCNLVYYMMHHTWCMIPHDPSQNIVYFTVKSCST